MESLRLKIDVSKIDKTALFRADSGALYLDAVAWVNRDGPGRYGDTHRIVQDLGKAARESGRKGAIIGNAKPFGANAPQQRAQGSKPAQQPREDHPDEDVPF
jgi:hypothetical protein